MDGDDFYKNPKVLVDCPLQGVDGLRNAAQKHCRDSDVLARLSELGEIVPLVHDVVLDLTGVTTNATCRATCMGRNVLYRLRRPRWWLVLPPLS